MPLSLALRATAAAAAGQVPAAVKTRLPLILDASRFTESCLHAPPTRRAAATTCSALICSARLPSSPTSSCRDL